MMTIELALFLMLVGAATGSIGAMINFPPTFIALSASYFFLPVFGVSFDEALLPVIATCIFAFLPLYTHAWIQSMKGHQLNFPLLIRFAPGVALGAVIGAQILSFIPPVAFKVCFSLLVFVSVYNILLAKDLMSYRSRNISSALSLPVGIFVGTLSLLAGNCGRVLGETLYDFSSKNKVNKEATVLGLIVFSCIAALVGFSFPAQDVNALWSEVYKLSWFAGAVHLPSALVIMLSHAFAYWGCKNRGNDLDKGVLLICCLLFLMCTLVRFWFW